MVMIQQFIMYCRPRYESRGNKIKYDESNKIKN